jgi:hypothetical protein
MVIIVGDDLSLALMDVKEAKGRHWLERASRQSCSDRIISGVGPEDRELGGRSLTDLMDHLLPHSQDLFSHKERASPGDHVACRIALSHRTEKLSAG